METADQPLRNDGGLLGHLLSLQESCGGTISFERFMTEALHHPRFGYYAAHVADIGSRGDFATSATLSDLLGKAVANWASARAAEMGCRRIPLIEAGAGSGMMARSILDHLGWFRRLRTDYLIVESSPVLRERQERLLRRRGVRWLDSMESALALLDGSALIFSNELVDAFPCRLFEKTTEGWHELGVRLSQEGALTETSRGIIDSDPWFTRFGELPFGQRVERHDSYRNWLGIWGRGLRRGSVLTIDYGDCAGCIYERRQGGTLRAYWKHRRVTGSAIYSRFGKQDLTADVNFDDLRAWGGALGWRTVSFGTQAEFLGKWGPGTTREADGFLSSGEGAGEAFKVLEQAAG